MWFKNKGVTKQNRISLTPKDYSFEHACCWLLFEISSWIEFPIVLECYDLHDAHIKHNKNLIQKYEILTAEIGSTSYYLTSKIKDMSYDEISCMIKSFSVIETHVSPQSTEFENDFNKSIHKKDLHSLDVLYLRIDYDHGYIGVEWADEYKNHFQEISNEMEKRFNFK